MHCIAKKFIYSLCMLLIVLLLLPSVASCGRGNNKLPQEDTTLPATNDETTKSDIPTPITEDFNGYEFKVLTRKGGLYESNDITADLTGNVVDQAVYRRNATLENKYNFIIIENKSNKYEEEAKRLGASGEAAYDMWSFAMTVIAGLAQEGYLYNLNEVKGLNLDAPYYDQNTRENASFAGYLFTLTGDMLTADDISTNVTLMNQRLYEQYHLDEVYGDIYDVVLNGEWTFDKMKTFASLIYGDADGDGVMTANDRWAGSAQVGHLGNFYIAFGYDLLKKNSDDTFELNDDPALISRLQDTIAYLRSESHYWKNDYGDLYTRGNQLFWYCQIAHIPSVRAAGIENIILPNPKYDDNQSSYYTFVPCYGSNCITICSTVKKNIDLVANIIELTSYESMNTVTPALVEYLIGGRILDNEKDASVMQVIMSTKTYSYNDFWSTGGIASGLATQLEAGSTEIAHVFAACKEEVNASVARKLERLQRLG